MYRKGVHRESDTQVGDLVRRELRDLLRAGIVSARPDQQTPLRTPIVSFPDISPRRRRTMKSLKPAPRRSRTTGPPGTVVKYLRRQRQNTTRCSSRRGRQAAKRAGRSIDSKKEVRMPESEKLGPRRSAFPDNVSEGLVQGREGRRLSGGGGGNAARRSGVSLEAKRPGAGAFRLLTPGRSVFENRSEAVRIDCQQGTVATTARAHEDSITHTVRSGGALGSRRGPRGRPRRSVRRK